MNSKNDNTEIMINDKADEVMEEFFQSLLSRYQIRSETSMKGSNFLGDCVHLLYWKCHKINFKQIGLDIDSPAWIKNEKAIINSINKEDKKCFQHAATVALNYEEIEKYPQRSNNWEATNYPSKENDRKQFGKDNETIALNILPAKKKKYILPTFQTITQIVKNKLLF